MYLNGFLEVFLVGGLGYFFVEALKVADALRQGRSIEAKYAKSGFWIGTLVLYLLGGLTAAMHGVENVGAFEAVQLGLAAPALFTAAATATYTTLESPSRRPMAKKRRLEADAEESVEEAPGAPPPAPAPAPSVPPEADELGASASRASQDQVRTASPPPAAAGQAAEACAG